MPQKSAGILIYRTRNGYPEVLLVHPGGPFWAKKDLGAWSIPKGEFESTEDPLTAAVREVEEETGFQLAGTFIPLSPVRQKSGKIIYAWATNADVDETQIISNHFEMEWPPRSGVKKSFPEVDRAAWFTLEEAGKKMVEGQVPLLNELLGHLDG
jgi:predicted NUDIX family NTP pyrophosphohydrolase